MDKRFITTPRIDVNDWESIVMEEMGYKVDRRRFDWDRFNEEHGITAKKMGYFNYWDVFSQIKEEIRGVESGYSFATINRYNFSLENLKYLTFSPEIDNLRKQIIEAALRCFDKGIAPEEFVLEIN